MKPIYIPNLLQRPERTEELDLDHFIEGLETLTPVRGSLSVTHQSTYLDVRSQAETIATLVCHRCLAHYNHRLQIDTQELIWLEATKPDHPSADENQGDELLETLPPTGHFDPQSWLYEQLSLALPFQQVCGVDCPGIVVETPQNSDEVDRRWAGLASLKDQLSQREE